MKFLKSFLIVLLAAAPVLSPTLAKADATIPALTCNVINPKSGALDFLIILWGNVASNESDAGSIAIPAVGSSHLNARIADLSLTDERMSRDIEAEASFLRPADAMNSAEIYLFDFIENGKRTGESLAVPALTTDKDGAYSDAIFLSGTETFSIRCTPYVHPTPGNGGMSGHN